MVNFFPEHGSRGQRAASWLGLALVVGWLGRRRTLLIASVDAARLPPVARTHCSRRRGNFILGAAAATSRPPPPSRTPNPPSSARASPTSSARSIHLVFCPLRLRRVQSLVSSAAQGLPTSFAHLPQPSTLAHLQASRLRPFQMSESASPIGIANVSILLDDMRRHC